MNRTQKIMWASVLAAAFFCVAIASCSQKKDGPPKLQSKYLKLEKFEFTSDEILTVTFTAPPKLDPSAWFGIVPSEVPHGSEEVNDEKDIAFHKLNTETGGDHHFPVPDKPGAYDIRFFDNDSKGKEIDSISFKVVAKKAQ